LGPGSPCLLPVPQPQTWNLSSGHKHF
jgi:hypothetical protein